MPKRILIVGGGASGVLLAIHLLHRGGPRQHRAGPRLAVTIVEKRSELGAGAAYATNHPGHLLNVRAFNMSAFPADPDHFTRWLATRSDAAARRTAELNSFAPRHLYRDYLAGMLAPYQAPGPDLASGMLTCIHQEARGIVEDATGLSVLLADGRRLAADAAVIATGNEGPSLPPEPWRFEGWTDAAPAGVDAEAPIVVVGTGLTMADRVLALLQAGHRGPITAVSRHGLVPQSHRAVTALPTDAAAIPFGASPSRMTAWLRARCRAAEAAGGDWRSVVDGLRPHTAALWQAMSLDDRKRFLRHARPFWDQHRHRIAPETAARLATARGSGQLRIVAAHVTGFTPQALPAPQGTEVAVHIAHRGSRRADTLEAQAVFECRGRSPDVTKTENPVLRQLLETGAARPDPLALGLEVTERCALIDAAGRASPRLFALGPVTAGIWWEIVAIPDIRQQAAGLAADLAAA